MVKKLKVEAVPRSFPSVSNLRELLTYICIERLESKLFNDTKLKQSSPCWAEKHVLAVGAPGQHRKPGLL